MVLLVVLFAVIGVGLSTAHFLSPPYNDQFALYPAVVKSHVVLGGLYLGLGALQFAPWIRKRFIAYHRAAGRLLSGAALVVGATAIFIGVAVPFSGRPEQYVMTLFGTYFVVAVAAGVAIIRAGDIAAHRRWMIRAYAIGSAVVTMRLIFVPTLVLTQSSTREQTAMLSIGAFAIAFMAHAILAELYVRRPNANG